MSQDAVDFLDKINTNMIRAGIIEKAMSRPDVMDRIVKYNKLNNNSYIEMIKMGVQK